MGLFGEGVETFFEVCFGGIWGYAEDVVVVFFGTEGGGGVEGAAEGVSFGDSWWSCGEV